MPVGQFTLTNTGKESLTTDNVNQVDWVNDTIVAVLLGNGYTPSLTHTTFADISSYQITDVGYAPVVLSSKTSTLTSGKILWDCADISFGTNVSITAKYLAFVKRAGTSLVASDRYLAYVDLDTASTSATVSSVNSNFAVNTPNGLFDL